MHKFIIPLIVVEDVTGTQRLFGGRAEATHTTTKERLFSCYPSSIYS